MYRVMFVVNNGRSIENTDAFDTWNTTKGNGFGRAGKHRDECYFRTTPGCIHVKKKIKNVSLSRPLATLTRARSVGRATTTGRPGNCTSG